MIQMNLFTKQKFTDTENKFMATEEERWRRWMDTLQMGVTQCTVLVAESCPTLWDPTDCSPPGSSVHGILQQEYWSQLPFPSPGNLPIPNPGIEPRSPAPQADSLPSEPPHTHIRAIVEQKELYSISYKTIW